LSIASDLALIYVVFCDNFIIIGIMPKRRRAMSHKSRILKLTKLGALWIHDGNPQRPHALLTSGNHSNGFFNASFIM